MLRFLKSKNILLTFELIFKQYQNIAENKIKAKMKIIKMKIKQRIKIKG